MDKTEELLKEFHEVRERYNTIVERLVELGIPGITPIDEVAAACNVGEVCHGGEFLTANIVARRT